MFVNRHSNCSVISLYFSGAATANVMVAWGDLLVIPRETTTAAGMVSCWVPFYCDVTELTVYAVGSDITQGAKLYWDGTNSRVSNQESLATKFVGYSIGAFGSESASPLIAAGSSATIQVMVNWAEFLTQTGVDNFIKSSAYLGARTIRKLVTDDDLGDGSAAVDVELLAANEHSKIKILECTIECAETLVGPGDPSTVEMDLYNAAQSITDDSPATWTEGTESAYTSGDVKALSINGSYDEVEADESVVMKCTPATGEDMTAGMWFVNFTYQPIA